MELRRISSIKVHNPKQAEESTYTSWAEQLQSGSWQEVKALYATPVQFELLRALTIVGIDCDRWSTVFSQISSLSNEWSYIAQLWLEQRKVPEFGWFVQNVAQAYLYYTFYEISPAQSRLAEAQRWKLIDHFTGLCLDYYEPVLYPVWLRDYGYIQEQYIKDLKSYWLNLLPEYYRPWPGTIIGADTTSIATIKQMGEQSRREIGVLFNLANKLVESPNIYVDRHIAQNGDSYAGEHENEGQRECIP